jgi:transcriptional regulator with XRE-family HTH domain
VAFGVVLRELRNKRDLSQDDVASMAGLSQAFIAGIELGHREPTLVTLFRIATALDVPPSDLLARMERVLRRIVQ